MLLGTFTASPARADDFDRLEGPALAEVRKSQDATAHDHLTIEEIGNLPNVLRGTRSGLVVVTTDQGNLARLLISSAFRKAPGGQAVPVIVLERFDTFEAGKATNRVAHGKDVLLFPEFQFDLDSGQVVPTGQGGDIQFEVGVNEHPRLIVLEKSKLYTLARSPVSRAPSAGVPSAGRVVLPGDFAGRFRLFANGQWSGTLDLKVDAQGAITGQFRSDETGTSYAVAGQVAADEPHRVRFNVVYPRSRQDFDGHLWTQGKGAMAGSVTLQDRTFGFFALREGGRFASEESDLGPLQGGAEKPGPRVVIVAQGGGKYLLDGTSLDDASLTEALKAAVAEDPATGVLLRAAKDLPYAEVARALDAIRPAGISKIRLEPAE